MNKSISVDEFNGRKWGEVTGFVSSLKDIQRSGSGQNYDNRGGYNHNRNESQSRPKSFWVYYDTNDYNSRDAAENFIRLFDEYMTRKRRFVSRPLNKPELQAMDYRDLHLMRSQIRGSGILSHVLILPSGMDGSKYKRDIERFVAFENTPSSALTQDKLRPLKSNQSIASTPIDLQFIITDTCYKKAAVFSTIEGL